MSQVKNSTNGEAKPCVDVITETVGEKAGIIEVKLTPSQQQVAIDYNPRQVSAAQVEKLSQQLTIPLQHNMETCTMRLHGSSCESCALVVERKVQKIEGVRHTTASYAGGVLKIKYDNTLTSPDQLMYNVKQLGINVKPSSAELPPKVEPSTTEAKPSAWQWLNEQNIEAIFAVIAFITMMSAFIMEYFGGAMLVVNGLYLVAYVTGGAFGFKGGIESLMERTIDVDLLMVLAALGAAYVGAPFEGAMLLFLFSLSNVLQAYAMDKTRNAIRALMKLRPNQALIRRGQAEAMVPIEQVNLNDTFIVKPGDRVPLDGKIIKGQSAIDQSSVTGESIPVSKVEGDMVLAGTMNQNGHLEVSVTKLARDSTIAKLIKLVEEAQSEKAQTQRFLDTAEQYYAIGVIVFTFLTAVIPMYFWGELFDTAFYRAMTVMVAASPCALIISTPAAILSAIGNGARQGVLFKGGVYVERAATIKVITFDKTGTLTEGKPVVTDIQVVSPTMKENELLALAASLEAKSQHPLGQAIIDAAKARQLPLSEVDDFHAETGKGVRGMVKGNEVIIGNARYLEDAPKAELAQVSAQVEALQNDGKTSVIIAQKTAGVVKILGVIAIADKVRAESAAVVKELKALGVEKVVMLTGDNERVAQAIAKQIGVDEYYADLLPEDKVRLVKELQAKHGTLAMVGDGVNDAPALASANIGIAMGAAGSDVALETADVVLLSDKLSNIPYLIDLSRHTRRTLMINLGFALFMIVLMIASIFTFNLPLPLAVVGHEGGTVLVSLNGLRLLFYKR